MKDKKQIKEERKNLRTLVNKWDPAGLIQTGSPDDEYDCLSDKIYSMLNRNVSEEEMIQHIVQELEDHFGCSIKPESIMRFIQVLNKN